MKMRMSHCKYYLSSLCKFFFLILILLYSLIGCTHKQFNNAGDFDSHEFTETQILSCILKGSACSRSTSTSETELVNSLIYTGSPFTFLQFVPITSISPSITATLSSCEITPALPTGLIINVTNCSISGTPTVSQVATSYNITATNANGNLQTTISIAVSLMIQPLVRYHFTNGSTINSGSLAITLGSPEWAPTVTIGKDGDSNGAYLYTTNNQYFTGVDTGLPMGASPRTMCSWINPSVLPANTFHHMVIRYGNTAATNVSVLGISNNAGVHQLSFIGSSYDAYADYIIPINTWSHLCSTFNGGTTASFYVNGIFIGTSTFAGGGPLNTISASLAIGTWTGSGGLAFYWRGALDDIQIYGTALSSTQISQIHSYGMAY